MDVRDRFIVAVKPLEPDTEFDYQAAREDRCSDDSITSRRVIYNKVF
jgi:hypothetical protein